MTKNDEAWERFFDATPYLSEIKKQGYTYVSASELKEFGKREPRLMAKHDTLRTRPAVFQNNQLTIFPVKNGKYIIFRDPTQHSYFDFGTSLDDLSVEEYRTQVDISKYDAFPDLNFSESQTIDYAFIASLIGTFTGQKDLFLTIRGRHRSGKFYFTLPNVNHTANINGVQIEVDSGYENDAAIVLIEAKMGRRENFHIRQLYYPYLEWSQYTTKSIISVFLTYTNGKFYFTQFAFESDYGSLTIVKNRCYTINESPVAEINLSKLLLPKLSDFVRRSAPIC